MFRHAKYSEKDELYTMWRIIFDDSDEFSKWFFTERFLPDYCAVWIEDNKIVSAAHTLPVNLHVRDAILPGAIIAGVATLPQYRGRGIMRSMMVNHLKFLYSEGIPLVVYRPVNFDIYRSLHHYEVADKTFLTLPSSADRPKCAPYIFTNTIEAASSLDELYALYFKVSARYSVSIARSYADFTMKYRDYASDTIKCIAAYRSGRMSGYCFYYPNSSTPEAPEVFAGDGASYLALISHFAGEETKRNISIALPPDVCVTDTGFPAQNNTSSFIIPSGSEFKTIRRTAAGITDVKTLLRSVSKSSFTIEVVDNILEHNSGIYDISGERVKSQPRITLDSGRLAQLIFGYAAASELVARGEAAAHDSSAASELDIILPKRNCFCAEEY